ncbi:DMT family transporter [Pararhizobium sp.]|uniref:DMT family transporter n=1 Tax=Pararhizobium sp. TaxID=1977563 RepID=UPI00271CDCC0|nr:DMT family transporter [Pararhizobium sp.]MDO9414921.1 DMT family transporter [Pararhizobium sp.]
MTLDRMAPALFVLLWSTGWVLAKYGGIYSGPLTFLCLRYALAALLFFAVCVVFQAPRLSTGRAMGHAILSGIFLHGLYLGAVWWAIGEGVPAAMSSIIAGLQPLMTAAAAPYLLGENLTGPQRLGVSLGFVGIAIAVLPKFLVLSSSDLAISAVPIVINIAGMAAATYGTIHQKKYLQTGDLRWIATLQYVGAFAVTVPFAFFLEDFRISFSWQLVGLLVWSVLGLSMGAIALLLILLRRGQVSRAASLIYLVPPLAAIQAAVIFGEDLTMPMIIGTTIAVLGVYLTNRKVIVPAE